MKLSLEKTEEFERTRGKFIIIFSIRKPSTKPWFLMRFPDF